VAPNCDISAKPRALTGTAMVNNLQNGRFPQQELRLHPVSKLASNMI
jgi:hypothetical protein